MNEKSPLTPDDKVLKKGKSIFNENCATCHGQTGKGDGPTGDPQHPPADLTDAKRMAANPDGIMFYKIWNGRKAPDMPAFKSRLTKEDVWTVIEYVKTLHQPATE
jgi:mono/diheme cytochrome c family protein